MSKSSFDYLNRLIDEHNALEIKISALHEFIGSVVFGPLSDIEKFLLKRQFEVMTQYASILADRISFIESK